MENRLHWGILAAGGIATRFARGVRESAHGVLHAVASRNLAKAEAFAQANGVPVAYGSYEELLADKRVQAVYVATPHPWHCHWTVKAAEAGKHVLCEKPLGMNQTEVMVMVDAARRHRVFLLEAYMYRCAPQTARLVDLVRSGRIGSLQTIEADFSFRAGGDPQSRLLDPSLGGGGILDVGGYPVSMARLLVGAVRGEPFADPVAVKALGHLGPTKVDEWACALLDFGQGVQAQVSAGVRRRGSGTLVVTGTEGRITVDKPWFCDGTIILEGADGSREEMSAPCRQFLWGYQADVLARDLSRGEAAAPAMSLADSLGNAQVLDEWRKQIGLTYPCETSASTTFPIARPPLKPQPEAVSMKYGRIPGLIRPVSKLILGVDYVPNLVHEAAMADAYIEAGGNAFDTARIYGGGRSERLLGEYLELRGIRREVVVLHKDAHTPYCLPDVMEAGIDQRLEAIRSDYIDLYVMHRDNPEVPVGEFVDVLNRFKNAGKVHAFGGSNWTRQRVDEANAYALRTGQTGFAVVNNNFSLARMVSPVWSGCVASSDPDYVEWHQRLQIPNLAWSSQARGFFTDRAGPDRLHDPELVRCWYREDNFERRARACQIARQRGVLPINVALAYVLCQPFPSWALIGPRVLEELRSSWPALDLELSPAELGYLDLRLPAPG